MGGEAIWIKILDSKYGEWSKVLEGVSCDKLWDKRWSSWWRGLVKFVGTKAWFREGVVRRIGNGSNTLFWRDPRVEGSGSLAEKFPWLFGLENDKLCTVASRVLVSESGVEGVWNWRRLLFEWESDLVQ